MAHLIDKAAVVAEIEKLIDKGKYHDNYECAFRDGNNNVLYALKGKIDTLEVKEVDVNKEISQFIDANFEKATIGHKLSLRRIAKHFFELGVRVNNPITAADRGTAEEIIINLKRVEKDYRIDLTREIEWLRNKVQKGE